MKSDKIIKITVISAITFLLLSILGLTYAYFTLEIEGSGKDIVMSTGDLRLEYKDETELKLDGAFPGDSISKVITVKNVGTKNATYSLYWGDLINTIENYELHVTLNCKSYTNYGESTQAESGTCENIYRAVPMSDTITTGNIKKGISIEPGITQEYTVTVMFDNRNYDQNYNKKKSFTGKIGIQEYTAPKVVKCTYDGTLTQGAEYVNGQYTYRYMQERSDANTTNLTVNWKNMEEPGWGVALINPLTTEDVSTAEVCTYINDKPVLFMGGMFALSQAGNIDLSSLNTSNVVSMFGMFGYSNASSLDLSSFDTRNVTNMSGMFLYSKAININFGDIDTSNVTSMQGMFETSAVKNIDLSNFNTENVNNMSYMFSNSVVSTLDLSSFHTSKVTNMKGMFQEAQVTNLDLRNFDTSNVTNMGSMFASNQAINLDVSGFDTSNVIDMRNMFYNSKATSLDVSNFDTSKVTDMAYMFMNCQTEILDVSNFDTSKVTDMDSMFAGNKATTINLNNLNTSNVINMNWMFASSQATTLDVSSFDTSKVTDMSSMFLSSLNLEKIYVSDKFVTTAVKSSANMFNDVPKLVGGAGTVYDKNNIDKTYARVDGGTSSPGYFTLKQ